MFERTLHSWIIALVVLLVVSSTSFGISRYRIASDVAAGTPLAEQRQKNIEAEKSKKASQQRIIDLLQLVERKLLQLPTDSLLLINAANISYELQDFKKAEQFYKRFIDNVDATNPALNIDYAYSMFSNGKTDQAIQTLQDVLSKNPKNQTAMYNLGFMYAQLQQLADAKLWMQRCALVDKTSSIGVQASGVLQELNKQ